MIKMSELRKYLIYGVIANGAIYAAKYIWSKYSQSVVAASPNEEYHEDENEVPADGEEFMTVSRFGLITNLFNGYGLIDKEIYFDLSVLVGLEKPREGLLVKAQVRIYNNGSQSVADHVEVMNECWEPDAPDVVLPELIEPKEISTLGKVTEIIEPNICWINNEICIDLNEAFTDDLRPVVGDWVTLIRLQDHETNAQSQFKYKLNLLRKKTFCGKVTKVNDKIAVVDDELFVIRDSCFDTVFCIGDEIQGTAIESSYENFEWRITRIESQVKVSDRIYKRHLNERIKSISQLVVDKEHISITSPINFGDVIVGSTYVEKVQIRNNGNKVQPIPHCYFENNCGNQLECGKIQNVFNNRNRSINPGEEAAFELKCSPKFLGRHQGVINFNFLKFSIARTVTFQAKDERQQLLQNGNRNGFFNKKSKYERQIPGTLNDGGSSVMVPGRRCEAGLRMRMPVYILKHAVPKELWQCHDDERDLLQWQPKLQSELTWRNYKDNFSTLLHLEEIQQTEDMAQFNMEQVFLKEEETFLQLEVPGLAEGRPSILIGDKIILTDPSDISHPSYEGFVHSIRNSDILIKFHECYHQRFDNKPVDIKFVISRTTFRRCHQAVQLFYRIGSEVLFPIKAKPKFSAIKFKPENIINKQLNERQICAVRSILEARQRPAPYIIYGPPGTGKTVTIIETILQVFKLRSDSRILVCASSNSAADLLCERLHLSGMVTTADLVRLNAAHRINKELPSTVEPYSHSYLPIEIVYRYRIIICTCVTAGVLYQIGVTPGHFTHVFIDEAGQATECELMIPVSVTAAKSIEDFQLILAGDPQQLGPVIRSKIACTFGLQISFLERLCNWEPYLRDESKSGGYNPDFVTKLIENYRSHPSLIEVSSKLFYFSELIPKASTCLTHSLREWDQLLNPDVMIIFNGIRSDELQEFDSPSWFNAEEIMQVISYLNSLYEFGIGPDDVGIITPYRRQVEKIKIMLSTLNLPYPKVGSVEEFQGQEKKAIIVSTVRSTNDCLLFDQRNNLGFLSNPKRFNVTLTRAQALLIIVGNPFLLIKDFYWRKFLLYCLEHKVYTGVDRDELVKLIEAIESGVN